jgi:UDP-N-acetylglucosamine--N-acetylmuramyl-(pentapeptide) pyrophosphoryl-undecaprenol N-acetylglucosamine transferase
VNNTAGRVVLTGGGSGGHITPLMAVAAELKRIRPDLQLIYIGQKGDKLGDIPSKDPNIDEVYVVRAGKFRRYHGEGIKQIFDLPTGFKNIRDAFYVLIGIWQSYRLMGRLKPDIVFSRGGFVSVPVALGATFHHIPFITHDSDPIPSLANRIIAPWASVHAVALPKEIYKYPQSKTVTTGIPLQTGFRPVSEELKREYRKSIGVPDTARFIFVIGGGLGAKGINSAFAEALPHLLNEYKDLYAVHIVGRDHDDAMSKVYNDSLTPGEQGRVRVFGYIPDVFRYSGAADIVITRAGATNLAEFAVQGKACIVIPSSFLVGGHQLKNAEILEAKQAAVVIGENDLQADPNRLAALVSKLLKEPAKLREMGANLAKLAKPNATQELAELILKQARIGS